MKQKVDCKMQRKCDTERKECFEIREEKDVHGRATVVNIKSECCEEPHNAWVSFVQVVCDSWASLC